MSTRGRVRLLAMGGTIAVKTSADGALHALDADDLAALVPDAPVDIETADFAQGSSIALTDTQLLELACALSGELVGGLDGVVVTHGTDTLEETLYFLALTLRRGTPAVVLTGAMRGADAPGADGPANLAAALTVAAHPPAAGLGPVLVLDGLIHAARFASKVSALSVGGWGSPVAGSLGRVVEGRPSVWLTPAYDDFLGLPTASELPRVELMRMAIGVGPEALAAVLATEPAALVIDGFGGGHVPPATLDVIDEGLAKGVPIVMSSRVGDGPTNRSTYGAPGCELDLQDRGAIMAGALSGVKARLRLAVAFALGLGAADVFPVD